MEMMVDSMGGLSQYAEGSICTTGKAFGHAVMVAIVVRGVGVRDAIAVRVVVVYAMWTW